jgi:hypothetical protein
VLMIETPHPLQTHSMSSLYIYNAIQHLLQRLQVIRMYLQPDMLPHGPKSDVMHGFTLGTSVSAYD